MQPKRYRSSTVRDALAQARADLGPTALVLSTRLVGDRGWRGWLGQRVVEVVAAADRDMSGDRPPPAPLRQPALEDESVSARSPDPARIDAIVARLCAAGLDQGMATQVAGTLPRSRRRDVSIELLRRAVADVLQPVAAGDEEFVTAEVFIGPAGVGKTTTIAKIAAQERVRRGVRLGLVAADGFRVGAVEQLRLYADIVGAPFSVARSPRELEAIIGRIADGPVLVDTAGRGTDARESLDLMTVLGGRAGVRTHLVLSAATPVRDAARLLDAYEPAQPARVVLTRLDEGHTLGPLVALLRARRRPVSFLGTGQRVPEDLARATPSTLAAYVLGDASEPAGDRA